MLYQETTNRQIQKLLQRNGWKVLQHDAEGPIWQPQTSFLWDPQMVLTEASLLNYDVTVAVKT